MTPDIPNDLDPRLILQGVHLDLTPAMQDVMREKLAVLLRHNDYIVRINVRLRQDQRLGNENIFSATAQIEIGGPDIVATAEGKEAYDVIDQLVDRLDRQLEGRHGRRKDRRNHPQAPEIDAPLPKIE